MHDQYHASIWLIDFAKTVILPSDANIDHQSKWSVGNHEDGYLIGINNLIDIFGEIQQNQNMPQQPVRNNNNTAKSVSSVPNPTTITSTNTKSKSNIKVADCLANNIVESSSVDEQLANISLNI